MRSNKVEAISNDWTTSKFSQIDIPCKFVGGVYIKNSEKNGGYYLRKIVWKQAKVERF